MGERSERSFIGADACVHPTIIVDSPDRHATPYPGSSETVARLCRDIFKTVAGIPCQQHGFAVAEVWIGQFDRVQVVSLGNEKISPSVIVIVQEPNAPSRVRHAHAADAGGITLVCKSAVAVI